MTDDTKANAGALDPVAVANRLENVLRWLREPGDPSGRAKIADYLAANIKHIRAALPAQPHRIEGAGREEIAQSICAVDEQNGGAPWDWYDIKEKRRYYEIADAILTISIPQRMAGGDGAGWRPIESAPRDGSKFWGQEGEDAISMLWHEGFGEFVSSWRLMTMAPGYTVDGLSEKEHSPVIHHPKMWMPRPGSAPTPNLADELQAVSAERDGLREALEMIAEVGPSLPKGADGFDQGARAARLEAADIARAALSPATSAHSPGAE